MEPLLDRSLLKLAMGSGQVGQFTLSIVRISAEFIFQRYLSNTFCISSHYRTDTDRFCLEENIVVP